jgi:GST-like protein
MTLHLHYWPTPNGKKVTVFLEEAELPYVIVPCNIARGDQFAGDFPRLNPNTRMPLLVDDEPLGGGPPISVFESARSCCISRRKALNSGRRHRGKNMRSCNG